MRPSKNQPNLFQKGRYLVTACILIIGFLLGASVTAWGGEVLDDSLSPQKQYGIQFQWAHRGNAKNLTKEEFHLLRSSVAGVEVYLDTAAYEGRRARIYIGLPRQIEGYSSTEEFLLSWTTDRIFSAGSVRPGNRALLFDGVVGSAVMVEMFTFILEIDARHLNGKIQYAPFYEIETY